MAGDWGEPACLCGLLLAPWLCSLYRCSVAGPGGGQKGKAAGIPYLPGVGLWQRGDLRGDVYQNVPVADAVCAAVPFPASSGNGKGRFWHPAFPPAPWGYGFSGISHPVLLYHFSFFPGSRVLPGTVKAERMEGAGPVRAVLRRWVSGGCTVLPCKPFPYLPGVPGDGGCGGVWGCFQYLGPAAFFLRAL